MTLLARREMHRRGGRIPWRDALRGVSEEGRKGARTLMGHSAAADANLHPVNPQRRQGHVDHGEAVTDETGSLNRGVRAVQSHIDALADEAVQAGLSREEVEDYIAKLNLTPRDKLQTENLSICASSSAKLETTRTGSSSTGAS